MLAGDGGQALAFGPGHRHGSALPGDPGLTLISGHRDTHFRFLAHLRRGDLLRLIGGDGGMHEYSVRETAVVAEDYRLAAPTEERLLVLATCWPLDEPLAEAQQRYLVFARAVADDNAPESWNQRPLISSR